MAWRGEAGRTVTWGHAGRLMALTCAAVAAWAALALAPAAAGAADITVTSNLDDGTGCTLREAISSANTGSATGCANGDAGGTDRITFDPAQFPPGGAAETITLNSSEPQITSNLAIEGYGMNQLTVVHGAGLGRVFLVSDTGTAEISGMTITGGAPALDGVDAFGGGIRNDGSLTLDNVCVCGNSAVTSSSANGITVAAQGGGVYSAGSAAGDQTTIMNSIVEDNDATATQSAASSDNASAAGGGIYVENEPLTVVNSTISNDDATATKANGAGTAAALGGGVFVRNRAMSVRGSTVNGNRVDAESPGDATSTGGGILLIGDGQDSLELSTVADNRTEASGGNPTEHGGGLSMVATGGPFTITSSTIARNGTASALFPEGKNIAASPGGNPTQLENSIVSDPSGGGGNCRSGDPVVSQGFSADYTPTPAYLGTCAFASGTDTITNPLLDPAGLADHGGPTETIALRPGSPMIDRGSSAGQSTPNVDQRGSVRPFDVPGIADADDGTDIGAFEFQPGPPPVITPPPGGGVTTPPPGGNAGATGRRAAALKKCKKKAKKKNWSKKKRKKCRKRARKLPV